MNRERYANETYEEYRDYLKWWEKGLRLYRRGRVIWDGRKGTYVRERDGIIGTPRRKKNAKA